jgi:hypothetical protein
LIFLFTITLFDQIRRSVGLLVEHEHCENLDAGEAKQDPECGQPASEPCEPARRVHLDSGLDGTRDRKSHGCAQLQGTVEDRANGPGHGRRRRAEDGDAARRCQYTLVNRV